MELCSTPKKRPAISITAHLTCSPSMEFRVLDQVSRMTLSEPSTPQAAFRTPALRKRKPSFVTPPRGEAYYSDTEIIRTTPIATNISSRKKARGLPPLLPDSSEMNGSRSHNLFIHRRRIHSPIAGASNINLDYFFSLHSDEGKENTDCTPRFRLPKKAVDSIDGFPDLELTEPTLRSLKMRREDREESAKISLEIDL